MLNKIIIIPVIIIILAVILGSFVWSNLSKRAKNLPQANPTAENKDLTSKDSNQDIPLVSVLAKNLDTPWALAFTPDDAILVTERPGRIRIIDKNGNLDPTAINVEGVSEVGEGGLLGIAVHPNYNSNHYIYLYYTSQNGSQIKNQVVRYRLNGYALTDKKVIINNIPGAANHDGGRIKFGPDGNLYITTGDAANPTNSQDRNSLAGKILRLTGDGAIPDGNPFGNATYSYGHRNPQGLAWDNQGRLWATEHGQSATDELNLIEPGKNYGWPTIRGDQKQTGLESPIIHSGQDTWAPGGAAFYNGSIFFGGLRGKSLFEAKISDRSASLERHFRDEFGRMRDVVLGSDGYLYATTSNLDNRGIPTADDDQIIRINPEKLN
jgi:glucose/arabinose dehydrogenase